MGCSIFRVLAESGHRVQDPEARTDGSESDDEDYVGEGEDEDEDEDEVQP